MKRALHSLPQALWILFFLTAAFLFAKPAYAASLTVEVKQVNPDGAAQTVTCTLLQKQCTLPVVINAGTAAQQSVNIQVVYHNGGLALNFKTTGGYFYTGSMIGKDVLYQALWNAPLQGGTSTYTVTLFQPLTPNLLGPGMTSTDPHTSVAKLEITATTVP
ncbi:MAG: hypothetical protein EPN97_00545 [Alphaproteobacteria bacterium]|nr:MAG: hypothetical protein EPN97_00545 [Alphaproteobacteria bacterium]